MTIPVEPEIEKEEGNLNSCLKPRFQDSYLKTYPNLCLRPCLKLTCSPSFRQDQTAISTKPAPTFSTAGEGKEGV